jgi:succinyl-CoA synthetase alpha subunit
MGSEFSPGKVAIISRSGTLCYEAVAATTRARLGQSMVIGIGGDRMPGTTYVDALQALHEDPHTKGNQALQLVVILLGAHGAGIVLIGEVGGEGELDALEYIKQHKIPQSKYLPLNWFHTN